MSSRLKVRTFNIVVGRLSLRFGLAAISCGLSLRPAVQLVSGLVCVRRVWFSQTFCRMTGWWGHLLRCIALEPYRSEGLSSSAWARKASTLVERRMRDEAHMPPLGLTPAFRPRQLSLGAFCIMCWRYTCLKLVGRRTLVLVSTTPLVLSRLLVASVPCAPGQPLGSDLGLALGAIPAGEVGPRRSS